MTKSVHIRVRQIVLSSVAACILAAWAPAAIADIFVTNSPLGVAGSVGRYTDQGVEINSALIPNLNAPYDVVVHEGFLYVSEYGAGRIGRYTLDGAVVDEEFIAVSNPANIEIAGSSLYVSNYLGNSVGRYDLSTGDPALGWIPPSVFRPTGIQSLGNSLLVASYGNAVGAGAILEFDATTGAALNSSYITDLDFPDDIEQIGSNFYVTELAASSRVSVYGPDRLLVTSFDPSANDRVVALAALGSNLIVADYNLGAIGKYTLDGQVLDGSFITGLDRPTGLAVSPPAINADFNGNGVVDGADYVLWRYNVPLAAATQAQGDADGDGDVDHGDFESWLASFGTDFSAVPSQIVVPEVASTTLLTIAMGFLMGRSRRRKSRAPKAGAAALISFACLLVASASAEPQLSIVPGGSFASGHLNAAGNWVWAVRIAPLNIGSVDTPLFAELGFDENALNAQVLSAASLSSGPGDDFDTSLPGLPIFGWEILTDIDPGAGTNHKPVGVQCSTDHDQVFAALGSQIYTTPGFKDFIQIEVLGPSTSNRLTTNMSWKGVHGIGGQGRVSQIVAGGAVNFDVFLGSVSRTAKPGDIDLNGTVSGADLTALTENFGERGTLHWFHGDFDDDQDVDGTDFLTWQRHLDQTQPVAAIPEPPTGLLAILGLAAIRRRRFCFSLNGSSFHSWKSPGF